MPTRTSLIQAVSVGIQFSIYSTPLKPVVLMEFLYQLLLARLSQIIHTSTRTICCNHVLYKSCNPQVKQHKLWWMPFHLGIANELLACCLATQFPTHYHLHSFCCPPSKFWLLSNRPPSADAILQLLIITSNLKAGNHIHMLQPIQSTDMHQPAYKFNITYYLGNT